jgi:hypothetical protein
VTYIELFHIYVTFHLFSINAVFDISTGTNRDGYQGLPVSEAYFLWTIIILYDFLNDSNQYWNQIHCRQTWYVPSLGVLQWTFFWWDVRLLWLSNSLLQMQQGNFGASFSCTIYILNKISSLMFSIKRIRANCERVRMVRHIEQWCPTTFSLSPHSPQLWRQQFSCRHFCQNFRKMLWIYHWNFWIIGCRHIKISCRHMWRMATRLDNTDIEESLGNDQGTHTGTNVHTTDKCMVFWWYKRKIW